VTDALLSRPASAKQLLKAIAAGTLPASALDAARRQQLLTSPDAELRAAATSAFGGAASSDRQKVIAAYRDAAKSPGDPERGRVVFVKLCSACHFLQAVGNRLGPDLAALGNKPPEYLLNEILDPNRNLDSRYVEYTAQTADGRTFSGLLAAETATAVTVRAADGKEQTIRRADLEALRSSGRSLMPEGLEKDIPVSAMADLLAYLATFGTAGGQPDAKAPATRPLPKPKP
jgi:putative heme-binding domain-containing protein